MESLGSHCKRKYSTLRCEEKCARHQANPKNLTHHHSSLSALKISELQAYKTISQRKIWIVRNFPNDCGRTIKVGKHFISKGVSGTQVSAVFLKGAKQEAEPAPTEQIKLTARKSYNLQHPTRKSNTLLRPKFHDKKLLVIPPLKKTCKSNASSGALKGAAATTRDRVKVILRLFQVLCRKFLQEKESHPVDHYKLDMVHNKHNRVDLKAFGLLKEEGMLLAVGKSIVGDVPGIEVGDEFHYRVELCLTGVHKPPMAGIDFIKINGKQVATSVVSSGMYADIMEGSDVLVYEGEGGGFVTSNTKRKPHPGDQKLVRGNLALANSKEAQLPVRVIFGFREQKPSGAHDEKMRILSTYVYDGLYRVEKYWSEIGSKGFSVFKFRLRRIPNQPQIPLKEVMMLKQTKIRLGLCMDDISKGKEEKPIAAINTVDKELPPAFGYMTKMKYPSWYNTWRQPHGCKCLGECVDPRVCKCAAKNGGDFPFNFDGAIVRAKHLVYECGPSCRCSSSCHNRVSQNGIKFQLEIFKTEMKGWGVRSLASIPSGSFVCEYTGELLAESEAQKRVCDDYLFAIGRNYNDETLWKRLSTFIPDLREDDNEEEAEEFGFAIDAAKHGGVGRFINHSCSPNLYAQNVLYDHDDKRVPHIMLFAAENIPPLKELCYHYNYAVDQVHDLEGNIKKKACHCGAVGCTGRLY